MPKTFSNYEITIAFEGHGILLNKAPKVIYEGRQLRFLFKHPISTEYCKAVNQLQSEWDQRWREYETSLARTS